MLLKEISLKGYRNYESAAVNFSENINVFLGENAQGKTNMMESIYVLAMARSHRTANDKELIGWEQDFAKVTGKVETGKTSYPLEIVLSKKGKKARLNHLEQKKLSAYIGHLNVILFAPEDLALVKGSPSVRRKFLDMEMGQMSAIYLYHLVEYQKILKQRNAYLKQNRKNIKIDKTYLSILNEQLAAEGAEVLAERFSFVKRLEKWAQPIHSDISQQKEELELEYASTVTLQSEKDKDLMMQDLLKQYEKNERRELERGTTLTGPHRDDVRFYVNGKNVQTYGSQGQQRTSALSVKLAEIELMKEMTGEYPVLLLDDVLSELDDDRQTHLLKSIQDKVQTFLTTTSLDGVKKELLNEPRIFTVNNGQIEMESE
ncbi:MAG: DNA replication/repair protein RecF [Alkalibacterium gilvum]|uniref:DNA replication and repair protein RecF n=1 Tax=Alkalibacterium gilvum TaxID=1130080 RepID=A0A1H6SEP8_9LACT|nr:MULTISPECIES: DNA replication/repair protein RecF [Alkalibacterium]MDN6293163.1 DNA replication/repair protein RecF [Alkalibacterium sp.]MDN6294804.1 DNA replication/repair protein RecF [Alkalibacterium sp.]MDN6385581.1 DNA replication/repair protein RecF [Alkalibacterium sp.]MDN6398071.1 DNA replication/repair protein RecF [Alkalibacterium sp.]MDN6729666.1 DNA replication/repair protein RecF [Alkalibacterium sp.]